MDNKKYENVGALLFINRDAWVGARDEKAALAINKELNRLQAELAAANNRVSELEAERDSLASTIEIGEKAYESRMLLVKAGITEMQSTINSQKATNEALQAENARLQKKVSELEPRHESAMGIALLPTTPPEPEARRTIQSWNFEVGIRDVLEAYDGKQLAGDEGLAIVEVQYKVDQMRDDIEHFTASYYDKWHYARSAGYLTLDKRPQLTQDGVSLLRSLQVNNS